MNKVNKLRIKDIEPFEHLDYVLKNTTPYQRLKWLEQAWQFWYGIRKCLPKRIVELQDRLRASKI